jgi:hypothetical protein
VSNIITSLLRKPNLRPRRVENDPQVLLLVVTDDRGVVLGFQGGHGQAHLRRIAADEVERATGVHLHLHAAVEHELQAGDLDLAEPGHVEAGVQDGESRRLRVLGELVHELGLDGVVDRRHEACDDGAGVDDDLPGREAGGLHLLAADRDPGEVEEVEGPLGWVGDHGGVHDRSRVPVHRRVGAEGQRTRRAGVLEWQAVREHAAELVHGLRDQRELATAQPHEAGRAAERRALVAGAAPEHEAVHDLPGQAQPVARQDAARVGPVAVAERVAARRLVRAAARRRRARHARGHLQRVAGRRVAGHRGVGRRGRRVEEGVLLVVARLARLALHPGELAGRVHDHRGLAAAQPDGGDVVQRPELRAGGDGNRRLRRRPEQPVTLNAPLQRRDPRGVRGQDAVDLLSSALARHRAEAVVLELEHCGAAHCS